MLNWKHAAQSDPVESSENAFGSRGITIGGERVFAFLLACVKGSPLTHVKISQLVASLQTSRQQVVFARLFTSCQQVWNKLLTTCNNLVDIVRLVTRLSQQGCYNHDMTLLLQPCVVNLVTILLYHACVRLVTTCLQTCNNLCVFTRVGCCGPQDPLSPTLT